jgi:hypothetical protein
MRKAKFKQVIDYKQSLFNQLEQMHWGVDTYLMSLDKFKDIDPIHLLAKMNAIIKRHIPHIKVKNPVIRIEPIKSSVKETK